MVKYIYNLQKGMSMKNIFKRGFTLSEALITLTVVGVVAILVVPGLIKDTTDKARIALLQSTISSIHNAIQNEIIRTGANNLKNTKLATPVEFLKTLDISEVRNDVLAFGHGENMSMKTLNGETKTRSFASYFDIASAKLKNGATVQMFHYSDSYSIAIDINGKEEPNIIGIDIFPDIIIGNINSDFTREHVGDIGYCGHFDETIEKCKEGSGCYCLLEQSGFDPHYLDE